MSSIPSDYCSRTTLGGGTAIGSSYWLRYVDADLSAERVRVAGKMFRLGNSVWYCKGVTYGPFAPRSDGLFLPEWDRLEADFRHLRRLGANAVRVYHVPPPRLLDYAVTHGLRVLVDVPWQKHRCFLDDWPARQEAFELVGDAARQLGAHPGLFALSVANEIPHDIVRYHGTDRVARFVDQLIGTAKQEAPDCLVTYANYPSTEFLSPRLLDFYCANVYVDEPLAMGRYLDRLQHVAGPLPLILGEHGADSMRQSEEGQAATLGGHLSQIFGHGLAGSFVYSYTDDWFTGGHQIENWAFGITDRQRREKPSAASVTKVWGAVPYVSKESLPRVSVVVCSYNGAATLAECLESLTRLDYPDFELILIDDGSTDNTREIAQRFPNVKAIHQENRGLSAARNEGLRAATGQIVAYTDSDCIVEPSWLLYLAQSMRNQQVDGIGGPNVPPTSDGWIAQCVAASPGGPSHVMLDDCRAEHVPGCNMAFDREKLLALGGFDVQFRQAGDDVDLCWRWLDAGWSIGYAPAALVWHHRRNTIRAYLKQQAGYGRSEAMLSFKHPRRFNTLGCSRWHGIIYGEGAVGLPVAPPVVYHGRFGAGLFQIIYRQNRYTAWAYFTLIEWHALALLALGLAILYPMAAVVAGCMWMLSVAAAVRSMLLSPLNRNAPIWCRPLVLALHLLQPVIRGLHRYACRQRSKRGAMTFSLASSSSSEAGDFIKKVSGREVQFYWESREGRGREDLLDSVVSMARQGSWRGDFDAQWAAHDLELQPAGWHKVRLCTATEELGGPRRFTRIRCTFAWTRVARVAVAVAAVAVIASVSTMKTWAIAGGVAAALAVVIRFGFSYRRCSQATAALVWRAGIAAGLKPVRWRTPR